MISALRYEWRRITTIRSTWILLALTILFSLLLGWATMASVSSLQNSANEVDQQAVEQISSLDLSQLLFSSTAGFLTLILLGTIAAQAFGQEYRQGTIRLTLTAIPFRGRVFSAKLIVVSVFVVVTWAIATVLTYFLMKAIAQGSLPGVHTALDWVYLGRGLLFVLGFCLIVFGVTVISRVLALGVIIPFVVWAVAEPLVLNYFGGSSTSDNDPSWIERILPFQNGHNFVVDGPSMATSGLTFFAWVVAVLLVAWVIFKKRDA